MASVRTGSASSRTGDVNRGLVIKARYVENGGLGVVHLAGEAEGGAVQCHVHLARLFRIVVHISVGEKCVLSQARSSTPRERPSAHKDASKYCAKTAINIYLVGQTAEVGDACGPVGYLP